ncbi:TRAP transporter large permease subunit [Chloroflexota bacterium]
MEWQLALVVILGSLLIMMATGMPIAFCFMVLNILGVLLWWGGVQGLDQLIRSMFTSVTRFSLLPLPLFILMGEVMFRTGIAPLMIDAVDKWLGRIPGRLGLLAVAAGTVLSTLTGASVASIGVLGSSLVPEMEKRGYKKSMSLGPVLGSGGLAIMIPPSGLAVFIGAIGRISIAGMLIAIIIPGLLMAFLYAAYIVIRCQIQPSIAPAYDVASIPLSEKLVATAKYILPVGFIIFMVIGVILLGIATPTEAAANGAVGTFILAACYRRLNWDTLKRAVGGAIRVSVMIFMIITGAVAFTQILAVSGATRGLIEFATNLPLAPILVVIAMQTVVLIMGMFMHAGAIIMICMPIFMPVLEVLGFNPMWFGVMMLLNIEMATTSPPFGLGLFVMRGVAPPGTTMGDIYRAALPFLYCDLVAMALILAFPVLTTWLPGLMRG